ncbi:hypothetical protein BD770DRAFT_401286 [Pilaira anomala]|nr:hypothetical protein BD770DRAFT_401286 [Pilaira anomala]
MYLRFFFLKKKNSSKSNRLYAYNICFFTCVMLYVPSRKSFLLFKYSMYFFFINTANLLSTIGT